MWMGFSFLHYSFEFGSTVLAKLNLVQAFCYRLLIVFVHFVKELKIIC